MVATKLEFKRDEPQSPYRQIKVSNLMALYRYVLLRARYRNLCSTGLFFVDSGCEFNIDSDANVSFGHAVQFRRDFTCHFKGNVKLGDRVFFNRDGNVIVLDSLTVGDHTIFGERVSIHDENHNAGGSGPVHTQGFTTAPIVIGRNVWVGANTTILQGVTIGDGAVIGAHAVVNRDVPAGMLAVGVPARIVRAVSGRTT